MAITKQATITSQTIDTQNGLINIGQQLTFSENGVNYGPIGKNMVIQKDDYATLDAYLTTLADADAAARLAGWGVRI